MFGLFEESTNCSIFIIGSNGLINLKSLFSNCTNLKNLDLSRLNTEEVTNMNGMFEECKELRGLNLSNFKTKNVTDMAGMFANCSSLKNLNINNFNTSKVINMSFMFNGCSSLKNLNLSSFNTENANRVYILECCPALKSIILNKNQEGHEDFIQQIKNLGLEKNVDFKHDKNPNLIQFIKKAD